MIVKLSGYRDDSVWSYEINNKTYKIELLSLFYSYLITCRKSCLFDFILCVLNCGYNRWLLILILIFGQRNLDRSDPPFLLILILLLFLILHVVVLQPALFASNQRRLGHVNIHCKDGGTYPDVQDRSDVEDRFYRNIVGTIGNKQCRRSTMRNLNENGTNYFCCCCCCWNCYYCILLDESESSFVRLDYAHSH